MYRQAPGCSVETHFALAIVDTCRLAGFAAGLQLSSSKVASRSQYVTVPHARGVSRIRISDHRRPKSACELYGDLVEDIDSNRPLSAALVRVAASLARLEPLDTRKPLAGLPAAFCGRLAA